MMNNREKRVLKNMPVQLRQLDDASEESRVISGTGIVFNQLSHVLTDWKSGEGFVAFREMIMPEAVKNIDWSGVVSCYNHEPNFLLGTGYAGTARYTVDERGVHYEIDAPDADYASTLIGLIKRGDIRGSSFIFTSNEEKDEWIRMEDNIWTRKVYEFSGVYEMGPVFGEAYGQTVANYRSYEKHVLEAHKRQNPQPEKDQQALDLLECLSVYTQF
jgi:uncharacterized protein